MTLGLDIGAHSIKMILLQRKGMVIDSISPRIIRLASTELRGRDRIENLVSRIDERVSDFKDEINSVIVSIQGPEVMVRRMHVPPMPQSELKSAIPWVINRFLPDSIDDVVYDYRVLGEKPGGGELELIVGIAQKTYVRQYITELNKVGLPPSVVTVVPCALRNVVRCTDMEKGSVDVVINIGDRISSINFISPERLEFSRSIMTAGSTITASLTGRITHNGREFTIDPEYAEDLKCRYGIPMGGTAELTDSGIPISSIQALIRPVVERLAKEIERSIRYATQAYRIQNIRRILVTGGSANLINIQEYLSGALGRTIEIFDPATTIESFRLSLPEKGRSVLDEFGPAFSVSLGLALEQGDSLNLATTEVHDIQRVALENRIFRSAASLVALVLVGTSLNLEVKRRIDSQALNGLTTTWSAIRSDPSFEEVQTLQDRLQDVEYMVDQLTVRRDFTTLLLKDVSHRIPEGVVLDELALVERASLSGETGEQGSVDPEGRAEALGSGEWELGLEGKVRAPRAMSEPILSEIMMDLDRSPFLKNPVLVRLDPVVGDDVGAMAFYITCDVIRVRNDGTEFL
jgi:type IV pilus assembly protein PilM